MKLQILDPSIWKDFKKIVKFRETSLYNRSQTGKEMYRISEKYFDDLGFLLDTDLETFFDFVRKIPYLEDKYGEEVVARPKYLLQPEIFPGLDCKKKAILIGAWAAAHGVPYKFLAVSENPEGVIHHVFPILFLNNTWEIVDATYPQFKLFEKKQLISNGEELLR